MEYNSRMAEIIAVHYDDEERWLNRISLVLKNFGFTEIRNGSDVSVAISLVSADVRLVVSDYNEGDGNKFVKSAKMIALKALFLGLAGSNVQGVDVNIFKGDYSRKFKDFLEANKERLLG